MSEVTLNVLDAETSMSGHIHGGFAKRIIASLAADPETIYDLERALGRFRAVNPGRPFFAGFDSIIDEEPYDTGIIIVDLAARLVVCQSTYFTADRSGQVNWHDGEKACDIRLSYCLSSTWRLIDAVDEWQTAAAEGRRLRMASPPLDTRAALYGKLAASLVTEVVATSSDQGSGNEERAIRDVHARWMITPREDLRESHDLKTPSPRDVILAHQDYISGDIESQAHHWSRIGNAPPGISQDSATYRYGGFGIHEAVLYYELVRSMLHACWSRIQDGPNDIDLAAEVRHLEELQQTWMHLPQDEELSGRSPAQIIALERARLPWAVTGEETMADCDCPLCQMMSEGSSPTFCYLDGCNMDDDFAFSFCSTREEWESERGTWEEWEEPMARCQDRATTTDNGLTDNRYDER